MQVICLLCKYFCPSNISWLILISYLKTPSFVYSTNHVEKLNQQKVYDLSNIVFLCPCGFFGLIGHINVNTPYKLI